MIGLGAFEDMRVELVGGRLEKMAPAYGGHSQQNFQIGLKLADAFTGQSVAIGTDLAVRIDDATTRGVDIAVGPRDFPKGETASGADVFLAVEIADTTLSRDLGGKAVDYARAGIESYWVVDLNGGAIHVMSEPSDTGYAVRNVVRFGEKLAVPRTDRTITLD